MARKNSVRTPKRAGDRRGTHPASLANLKPPWKAGDPSPNPSGRPKILGESYKAMLARVNESDPFRRTNAELIAESMKLAALQGDVSAAREIRAATEGERLRTWRDEVIDLLKARAVTPQEVIEEVGEELARELFVAAGVTRNESGEIAGARAQAAESSAAKS